MAQIKLENINKIYDNGFHAVHDFNLEIKDNEFIIMVGPSGCGKSTTLRMIAGIESISGGTLTIDGKVCNGLKPHDRGISMVFQSYALYPTMTVYDNLAFGLRLAGFDEDEIEVRVKEVSEILGIQSYLARKPKALSGGQQQRVALGRALIRHAKVFLMDEPLSNLDAIQRVNMRSEIRRIHNTVGATTIYVTHDQIEAMTMADRIVVMKDGYIQQIGTPKELYFKPVNMFVAGFIGDPQMNFIYGKVEGEKFIAKDGSVIELKGFNSKILENASKKEEVVIGFRPECCAVEKIKDAKQFESAMNVEVSEMLGDTLNIYGYLGKNHMVVRTNPFTKYTVGEDLKFYVNYDHVVFFDAKTEYIINED
jgi:multiple sugar transport system ATP-binding protein